VVFNGLEKNGSDIAASIAKEFQVQHQFSPANALHSDQLKTMVDEAVGQFKRIGLSAEFAFYSMKHDFPLRRCSHQ
jgi:3-hydroxybutyrate dehydrogenase